MNPLIKRLRQLDATMREFHKVNHAISFMPAPQESEILQAADEIERLQTEQDTWKPQLLASIEERQKEYEELKAELEKSRWAHRETMVECGNEIKGLKDRLSYVMMEALHMEPTELRLCEVHWLSLRPNELYMFTVDENCEKCKEERKNSNYQDVINERLRHIQRRQESKCDCNAYHPKDVECRCKCHVVEDTQTCPTCGGKGLFRVSKRLVDEWLDKKCPTCDGKGHVPLSIVDEQC